MRPVKNKKRIDPRYFLEETVLKEDVEQELEEGWLPSWLGGKTDEEEYDEKSADVYKSRRAKGMKQAASGEWYMDQPGHAVPVNPNEPDPGGARHIERGLKKQHQRPSDDPFRQIKEGGGN